MKIASFLYQDNLQLEKKILESKIDVKKQCLVRIHVTQRDGETSVSVAKKIKDLLPNALILGNAVSGIIYEGNVLIDGIYISIMSFDNTPISGGVYDTKELGREGIVNCIKQELVQYDASYGFLFFSDAAQEPEHVVEELFSQLSNISIIGGLSGYEDANGVIQAFVFDETGFINQGICIGVVDCGNLTIYENVVSGHEPISEVFEITKTDGNVIEEIEGIDTLQWLEETVGVENLKEKSLQDSSLVSELLVRFPLILNNKDRTSRFVRYDENIGKIRQYHGYLKEGTRFQVGYFSALKTARRWQEICYELQRTFGEVIFAYSCELRKQYLPNLTQWELGLLKNAHISGAFLLGEIGTKHGKRGYYNGTCAIGGFAEKHKYLELDLKPFEHVDEIIDDNETMLLKMKNAPLKEGKALYQSLVEQEERTRASMKAKRELGVYSMVDFLRNQHIQQHRKICLIHCRNERDIDESESSVYLENLLLEADLYLKHEFEDVKLDFYDYKTNMFLIVGDDSVTDAEFISATKKLYGTFFNRRHIKFDNWYHDVVVTKTNTKLHDMVGVLESYKDDGKSNTYFVCEEGREQKKLREEFRIVSAIYHAIKEDRVIPYFQGIYDNQKNNFYSYEALMRIQTSDGKMLFPADFLELSKKYGLYLPLSNLMVLKVLDLFQERKEIIGINISVDDILSDVFKNSIIEKLIQMKSAQHIMFELVDVEHSSDNEVIQKFIREIKAFGVRIAIDGFGSKKSNLFELGNLDFDFIKIDGSLIQLLGAGAKYDKILDSILYLGKSMKTELIAECVESVSMQKQVVTSGIRFSQGYFFSNPIPMNELISISEQNQQEEIEEVGETPSGSIEEFIKNDKGTIHQKNRIYRGGIIASLLAFVAIIAFANYNQHTVEKINDLFLAELAIATTDQISTTMEDSVRILLTGETAISMSELDESLIYDQLEEIKDSSVFDKMYISIGEGKPVDLDNIELENTELDPNLAEGEVKIFSPMVESRTGKKILLLGTNIYYEKKLVGQLYGAYYLESFANILDIKSFGGDAFFHLCEVNGEPLVLSGNSDNLFQGGDMYDFIGTLNMKNGHTPESLKKDMEEGRTSILKYTVDKEERTAVMIAVPNLPWCVVSIIVDEHANGMIDDVNRSTILFALVIVAIFSCYFIGTVRAANDYQRSLITALKSSYFLANSLQLSIETDSLTRTYTRATITEKITEAIIKARKSDKIHAVLLLDVDNFKTINDTYGHQTGDIYLQELVSAVKSKLRSGDLIGRLGGDEFIVLLSNIEQEEHVGIVVQRIIESVNQIKMEDVKLDQVSISAGVALIPKDGAEYEEINKKADIALYEAKESGKNKYVIYQNK